MLFYIVVVIIIFLALLAIFQIVYMNLKLGQIDEDVMSRKMQMEGYFKDEINKQTQLKIYGIIINSEVTRKFNSVMFDQLYGMSDTTLQQVSLPFSCKIGIKHINISMNRLGFLCLEINNGSSRMVLDCMKNDLHYVIIHNNVLRIAYDENMNKKLKDGGNVHVFTLYSFAGLTSDDIQEDCILNVNPFFGSFNQLGYGNTIDLSSILTNNFDNPIHLLGYKT